MGCDIHGHIEIKIYGLWHHYSCPPFPRCYAVFARICGVRGNINDAIDKPRGLPDNLSLVTQICFEHEKSFAHSATWLSKNEFCELIDWAGKEIPLFQHNYIGYLTGNSFKLNPDTVPKEIEDVRFICWFDN